MRFRQRLRESKLVRTGLAVGLGLSFWQTAGGLAILIDGIFSDDPITFDRFSFKTGGHTIVYGQLLDGLIEVAAIGLLTLVLLRSSRRPPL